MFDTSWSAVNVRRYVLFVTSFQFGAIMVRDIGITLSVQEMNMSIRRCITTWSMQLWMACEFLFLHWKLMSHVHFYLHVMSAGNMNYFLNKLKVVRKIMSNSFVNLSNG